jgi:hypothetical protein
MDLQASLRVEPGQSIDAFIASISEAMKVYKAAHGIDWPSSSAVDKLLDGITAIDARWRATSATHQPSRLTREQALERVRDENRDRARELRFSQIGASPSRSAAPTSAPISAAAGAAAAPARSDAAPHKKPHGRDRGGGGDRGAGRGDGGGHGDDKKPPWMRYPCRHCNTIGHKHKDCPNRGGAVKNTGAEGSANASWSLSAVADRVMQFDATSAKSSVSAEDGVVWLLDCAATFHSTTQRALLHNVRPLPRPLKISLANGAVSLCHEHGDVHLQTPSGTGVLHDVVYQPGASPGVCITLV